MQQWLQITPPSLLRAARLTIYNLRVPTTTLNFRINCYRKSYIPFISETVVALKSTSTSTFTAYDLLWNGHQKTNQSLSVKHLD
jgi:hypothetical protein